MKDPISGNEVPFGAKPEEVRDDVPILASEGEYVVPANVVRFLGLEKIENMVNKAKEALTAMGEVVGDEEEGVIEDDDSLPFDPNELQFEDDGIQELAEGGPVTENPFATNTTNSGVKQYKNKSGQIMFIPFYDGNPLFPVPTGYVENDPTAVTNQAPAPTQNVGQQPAIPGVSMPLTDSAKENGAFVEENKSPLASDPKTWGAKDFIKFGDSKGNAGNLAAKGIISMMPGGGLAMKAQEKWLDRSVASLFDDMMISGLDPQGNLISPEDMHLLQSTKESLKGKMGKDTGLSFNPADTLLNAVEKFSSFVSGGSSGSGGNPQSSVSSDAQKMLNTSAPVGYESSSSKDRQENGGGLGSDIGRDPSKGPSDGSMRSGGLYAKGGLVTRRK